MLIPRSLSSYKAVKENNGRLLPSIVVFGVIPNVISGISEPPTLRTTYPESSRQHHRSQQNGKKSSLSYHLEPEPEPKAQFPLSFVDIFGDDPKPQHSIQSESSSYHPELNLEACRPTTEDIFPSAPPVMQYPLTLDYCVYDYTTFLSTLDGKTEARPRNYQMPQEGARRRRQRHPNRYTPALGTSPRSRQF
ncbi:hypothetical protein PVK06_028061 [Gossypium arboreum]|uniref:Uncharacterized protein n=1 Tax=Gossypium arboreum TaxID=29729 RepID=A0ABR0P208_GOSAR|nr:hypothetical protein PVK06_028061 [Gossypium arboreum]